jgi:hypothetical protein
MQKMCVILQANPGLAVWDVDRYCTDRALGGAEIENSP